MRIFSKKALQFDDPAGQEPAVVVRSQDFATVPEWVVNSNMFKLASADGDVTVIESKKDELEAETGSKNKTKTPKEPEIAEQQTQQ